MSDAAREAPGFAALGQARPAGSADRPGQAAGGVGGVVDPPLWSVLRHPSYLLLCTAWFIALACACLSEIAAAWSMVALGASVGWVALIPVTGMVPALILALPSGALADLADRRLVAILAQGWAAAVGFALFGAAAAGVMTPTLLLFLCLLLGVAMALRLPTFAAAIPDTIPTAIKARRPTRLLG